MVLIRNLTPDEQEPDSIQMKLLTRSGSRWTNGYRWWGKECASSWTWSG